MRALDRTPRGRRVDDAVRQRKVYNLPIQRALVSRLRRGTTTQEEAVQAALRDKRPDVKAKTLRRYTTGLEYFQRVGSRLGLANGKGDGPDAITRCPATKRRGWDSPPVALGDPR